jgi:major membrane immunogen (membrane-anchored lipoprotein)
MKRRLSILLVVLMLFTLVSGCSRRSAQAPAPAATPAPAGNTAIESKENKTTDSTDVAASDSGAAKVSTGSADTTTSASAADTAAPATSPKQTVSNTPASSPARLIGTVPDPSKYKDGTYKESFNYFDTNGWKPILDIVIKNGKITSVRFDYVKANGFLKSADTAYGKLMKSRSGVTPAEASARLGQSLITTQDIRRVDTVTGATSSSRNFVSLAVSILNRAQLTGSNGSARPNDTDNSTGPNGSTGSTDSSDTTTSASPADSETTSPVVSTPPVLVVPPASPTAPVVTTPPTAAPDSSNYVDGSYRAFYDFVDGNGWKPVLDIVINNGKISRVKFDYVKTDGTWKTTDGAYANNMSARTGVTPAQASERLSGSLIASQDITKVDSVTGATSSSRNFTALGTALLTNAQTGNRTPAVLAMNSTYRTTGTFDAQGWRPEIAVTYNNGRITNVIYNEVKADGTRKRDDAEYNTRYMTMRNLTTSVGDITDILTGQLVATQSVTGVDVVSGATSTSTKFKQLATEAIAKRVVHIDGTYKATYDYTDGNGWKPVLDIVIRAGKIVSSVFDYIKPDGSLKSEDAAYAANMSSRTGVTPAEASTTLSQSLVNTQDISKVDSVTGATSSSKHFVALGTPLMDNSKQGDTSPLILTMNATYRSSGVFDTQGWKPEIAVTFNNGRITSVVYNEVKADGTKKRDDAAYNLNYMTIRNLTKSIGDVTDILVNQLIETQSVNSVDAVSGATSTSNKFKTLAAEAIAKRR